MLQPVPDLIKPPDLNQAKVNKCLIALVNRKAVRKENFTVSVLSQTFQLKLTFIQGTVLYHWQGMP